MAKNKNKKMARVKSGASKGAAPGAGGASGGGSDGGPGEAATKKKRVSPLAFIAQVRSETEKVTWPSRNEWFVTTIMVFIMVILASSFFFLIDIVIKQAITFLMGLGA
jgi:preprotein translocase subunit SecE